MSWIAADDDIYNDDDDDDDNDLAFDSKLIILLYKCPILWRYPSSMKVYQRASGPNEKKAQQEAFGAEGRR